MNSKTYLQTLHGSVNGYFSILSSGDWNGKHFHTSEVDLAAAYVDQLASSENVYVSMGILKQPPSEGRGKAKDVVAITSLWVEIDTLEGRHGRTDLPNDADEARVLLEGLPEPSIILHSGGGIHVFWLLDKPYHFSERAHAESYIRGVQQHIRSNAEQHGWTVDTTHSLAQTLRIPGTFNHKTQPPKEVMLIHTNDRRYNLAAFDSFLTSGKMKAKKKADALGEFQARNGMSVAQARDYLAVLPPQLDYFDYLCVLYVLVSYLPYDTALELAKGWTYEAFEGEIEAKFDSFRDWDLRWTFQSLARIATRYGWQAEKNYLPPLPVDTTVHQRYVELPLPATKGVLIKSPRGTGKTEWLKNIIPPGASVLDVGHRKLLLAPHAERLNLSYYRELDNLKGEKRIAVTANSVHKLNLKQKYEYVVIDEAAQVVQHIIGDTMKDRRQSCLAYIEHFIRRADHVILLDADLDKMAYNWVARLIGEQNITVIENSYQLGDRSYVEYVSRNKLEAAIMRSVARGEKVYVATNSRPKTQTIAQMLRDEYINLRLMEITSDDSSAPEVQDFITHINDRIEAYDAVVVSPSLGTGVSIDVTHFDKVFVLGETSVNTHYDLMQAAGRVRNYWC